MVYCLSSISGGAVSYLRNLVPLLGREFLKSSGAHSLCVLAHEKQRDNFPSELYPQCLFVSENMPTAWHRIKWERKNIESIVQRNNIDILFIPYQVGPKVRGVERILMLRNMEPFFFEKYIYGKSAWIRNKFLQWLTSKSLRSADKIIAVSSLAVDYMTNNLAIQTTSIKKIYHGRDMAFSQSTEFERDRGILDDIGVQGDFLLTCGSLLPYRRCEDVINAFNGLGADNTELQLVIAGSGSDKRYADLLRRRMAESPYRDRILAVGHVSKDTMIALYGQAKLCVIATEIEACPNIAIEAMSSGCAIVSCDRSPLPEMFDDCSLEYSARDIQDLSSKIRQLLEDTSLRNDFGKRALKRADDFSWAKCAQQTYSALVDWPPS